MDAVKPEAEVVAMLERARRKRDMYADAGAITQLMVTRWVEDLEELPRLLANARAAALDEALKRIDDVIAANRDMPNAVEIRAVGEKIAAAIRRLK